MKGWLLDTNVLGALSPGRAHTEPELRAWVVDHSSHIFLSAVSITEVQAGIARLRRLGAGSRADGLVGWLARIADLYGERVLSFDRQVALVAGDLSDFAVSIGRHPGFADIAIAATAKVHDLTVLTRNVRHFEPLGIALSNPWANT